MDQNERDILIRVDTKVKIIHASMQPLIDKVNKHDRVIWLFGIIGAVIISVFCGVGIKVFS